MAISAEQVTARPVTEQDLPAYERFVRSHPKGHFMQTAAWGAQKTAWRWRAAAVWDEAGNIRGTCAVLLRRLPLTPWSVAYACRGPVCDGTDEPALRALVDAVRRIAAEYGAYAVIFDPDVSESDRAYWKAMEQICRTAPERTVAFEGIQPRFVYRLALTDKTPDELFAAFSQKTRYNVRVAVRKGVTARPEGQASCREFYALMRQTARRDGFTPRKEAYFESLLQNFGEDARLYMARLGGEALAGALAVHCGDKVWYLYGASGNVRRDCMPNELLQWEMIRWAKQLDCRVYDFRGVSGDPDPQHPLYGLARFKKGFGGELTAFGGQLRIVEKPAVDKMVKTMRKIREEL